MYKLSLFLSFQVPQPGSAVAGSSEYEVTVRRKHCGLDRFLVFELVLEINLDFAVLFFPAPQAGAVIKRGSEYFFAVRGEFRLPYPGSMSIEGSQTVAFYIL